MTDLHEEFTNEERTARMDEAMGVVQHTGPRDFLKEAAEISNGDRSLSELRLDHLDAAMDRIEEMGADLNARDILLNAKDEEIADLKEEVWAARELMDEKDDELRTLRDIAAATKKFIGDLDHVSYIVAGYLEGRRGAVEVDVTNPADYEIVDHPTAPVGAGV